MFISLWAEKHNFLYEYDGILSSYPYDIFLKNKPRIEKDEFCWRKAMRMLSTSSLDDNCFYMDSDEYCNNKTNEYYKFLKNQFELEGLFSNDQS